MLGSVIRCCVPKCGKTREDDAILHTFPNPDKEINRFLQWTLAAGIDPSIDPQFVYKHRKVCHDHFEVKFLTWSRRLSPAAVPTLLVPGGRPPTPVAVTKPTLLPRKTSNKKELVKMVKKLIRNKDSYTTRLKKARKLSQNYIFQSVLAKYSTLAAMFTLMQFREIGKNKMGRRFTDHEKIMALDLYKRSPRTYRWLQKMFVLPSSMTLRKLIARVNLKPGFNNNIFKQLKKRVAKMKADKKLCILLFHEMAIAPHVDYNELKDEVSGFVSTGKSTKKLADHALVFMIRGIKYNYKQPVSYTFSSGSTNSAELANMIKDVVRNLHRVGLRVLATVCDQGMSNVCALNILIKETKGNYLRKHKLLRRDIFEIDGEEVVPLFDPPHLIKEIRNNLMVKNLICSIDGERKVAKWEHLVKLYEQDCGYKGIPLVEKFNHTLLNPDKFQKMKVKYATQLLSQSVAVMMGFLAEHEILPYECTETADVILFFDELFDSVNGSPENSRERSDKKLLMAVTPRSEHSTVWAKAKLVLKSMIFKNDKHDKSLPTIRNWLRTIENIEYLIQMLKTKYNVKSVWMRHFNQDPLENFFASIFSHGCRNKIPTAAGFESSFALLLINNLSGQHLLGSNCEEDNCKAMLKSMELLYNHNIDTSQSTSECTDFDMHGSVSKSIYVDFEKKKNNPKILSGLQYVTGYVLKKLKTKVFKNCNRCNYNLFDKYNKCDEYYLTIREYKNGQTYFTYPDQELIVFISILQDILTKVLKVNPHRPNLKCFITEKIKYHIDMSLFSCQEHKIDNIKYIINLTCRFFICNWCEDINKIINGKHIAHSNGDKTKKVALNYFKKRHQKRKINI